MVNESSKNDTFVNSLIGEGTFFRGEVSVNGLLRIDGDFSGSIKTKGKVFIGRNGRADCTIYASSVVVGGVVRGTIVSTGKVIILASAVVIGAIHSPRLVAEEGVILDGSLNITGIPKEETGAPRNGSGTGKKGFFGIRRIRPAEEAHEEKKILVSRTGAWNG
jgi:cytoskeletal protein CcmA (bactofilin family)